MRGNYTQQHQITIHVCDSVYSVVFTQKHNTPYTRMYGMMEMSSSMRRECLPRARILGNMMCIQILVSNIEL